MIHVEHKTLIIRGGASFNVYGDPYDYCLSVFIDGTHAHIFGLCGKFSHKDYQDVKNALISLGITKAHWERKKGSLTKLVVKENKKSIAE
jgi:hypothetical protein